MHLGIRPIQLPCFVYRILELAEEHREQIHGPLIQQKTHFANQRFDNVKGLQGILGMHDAAGTFDVVVQTFRQQHCRTCPSENPICHELILVQFPYWISEVFPQLAPIQFVPRHHIVHTVFLTTLPHAIYARTCPERVRYRRVFLTTDGSGLLDGVSVSVLMEYRAHNEISMILLCGVDHGGDVIRFHVIVAVNEGDELASRHIQSGITGRGETAVGL